MDIFLIDGIGPFFRDYHKKRINWSKTPFPHLETGDEVDHHRFIGIRHEFTMLVQRAQKMGYNAVSLDDMAHLVNWDFYPETLQRKIAAYQTEFEHLFQIADQHGMQVYITTDIMFFHPSIEAHIGTHQSALNTFFAQTCERLFKRFPAIKGIITRFGESDGKDVTGDFLSRLVIKRPHHARRLLKTILPLFEQSQKHLIFRTWCVGAYPIGDLMWNRNTFNKVFGRIESPNLIISMKYGESDFFKYLPLNKQFKRTKHRKLIELQARREYEGAGQFPTMVGWDYENYYRQLKSNATLAGIMVWCQTGGWMNFRRLTFLDPDAIWNEINCQVCIDLFRHNLTTEQSLRAWAARHSPTIEPDAVVNFFRLADDVVREILYIDGLAQQKLFFRRLRLPPLLSVYWDNILVNHAVAKMLRCFIDDREQCIRQGYQALAKINAMKALAEQCDLPVEDIEFQYDTFHLMAVSREYYFRPFSSQLAQRLYDLKAEYKARHPRRYALKLDFSRVRLRSANLQTLFRLLLRQQRGYRLVDKLFTLYALAIIFPLIKMVKKDLLPEYARNQAMGLETIFK